MKPRKNLTTWLVALTLISFAIIYSCTHKDQVAPSNGSNITRGTQVLTLTNPKLSFEKAHSNVGWETPYSGSLSLLTGRFNSFGFTSFNFDEANPAASNFECWVELNTVNTGEAGRDTGCLLGTYHTGKIGKIDQRADSNLAVLKTTSIEYCTTDAGYIVKGNLKFLGVTKSIIGKMTYDGSAPSGTKTKYGLSFTFQILSKTDFGLVSTNIADNVILKCNAIFTLVP
jgi:polyisoprenoid-binding protein YceI